MAVQISFRLRENQKGKTPSQQKETPVNMFVNFGYYMVVNDKKKYVPVKYSTGEKIKPFFWNGNRAKQTSKFDYSNFNTRIDNIETLTKKALLELKNENVKLTPDSVKNRLNLLTGKTQKEEYVNLNSFIKTFIEEIETGKRLTEKKVRFSYSTIKYIRGFQTQFDLFQKEKRRHYDYDNITIDFYNDFLNFFNAKKYSPNTIGKYIGTLKQIMNVAKIKGYHENTFIDQKAFKKPRSKSVNIYLTEKELEQMYNEKKLTEVQEVARDVFLVGCYTALRYSDYNRLKEENIKSLENGVKVIEITQQKTGEKVIIPIKPELESILRKYNYNLPKTYSQKINDRIKEVAKEAKIVGPVIVEKIKGGLTIKETILKNKLIKTHTARRTGITNMYKAGIKPIDIMKISGHKTESEFMKYVKVGLEETATELSKHSYFAGTNLKIAK